MAEVFTWTRTAASLSRFEAANYRLQEPRTSGTQIKGMEKVKKPGPRTVGPVSLEIKGPAWGPSKCQRSSGGTPEGGQAKRLKKIGQPSYTRAAREGTRMAIVCDCHPEVQVPRENFVRLQRVIGGLVGELPEEGFIPSLINTYWTRGPAVVVCQDEGTRD